MPSNCAFIPARKNSARVSVTLLFQFLGFQKFCNLKFHNSVSVSGHVTHMGERRGAYRVLVGRPKGKRPIQRRRRR